MSTIKTTKMKLNDKVDNILNDLLNDKDEIKSLDDVFEEFQPDQNSILKPLFRLRNTTGTTGRSNEKLLLLCEKKKKVKRPLFLLYDLQSTSNSNNDVHEYIDGRKDVGGGSLYGASGIGKTRSIYEYLSHKFGFYFLAGGDNERNPGSKDLDYIVQQRQHDCEAVAVAAAGSSDRAAALQKSNQNLEKIKRFVELLIYTRYAVHRRINKLLGREITSYEWLLFQTYPIQLLGRDIFFAVVSDCVINIEDIDLTERSVYNAFNDIRCTYNGESHQYVPFIDEAQILLDTGKEFFLSSDGSCQRSYYSAVLKGFNNARTYLYGRSNHISYPFLSGTGLSFEDMSTELGSGAAKSSSSEPYFHSFPLLGVKEVKSYIGEFLLLDNDEVAQHMAKWLRGRPRFSAFFLENYLVRPKLPASHDREVRRGKFKDDDKQSRLIEAVDRYVSVMTNAVDTDEQAGGDKRKSFDAGTASAYYCIAKVKEYCERETKALNFTTAREIMNTLEKSILNFAIGEGATISDDKVNKLIDKGVAAVAVHDSSGRVIKSIVDEPIVIQAGINYFGLNKLCLNNMIHQNQHGQGYAFERLIVPKLQVREKLQNIIKAQLSTNEPPFAVDEFSLSHRSSYGVIASNCKSPLDTMKWILEATEAHIEGQVPPFCFPDNKFGPDLLFLMWDYLYSAYRVGILQSKFVNYQSPVPGLRTLVPKLFFHQKRDKDHPTLNLTASEKAKWGETKKLVDCTHPCLRILVKFPDDTPSKNVSSGLILREELYPGGESRKRKQGTTGGEDVVVKDAFLLINGENGESLFGSDTCRVLELVKQTNPKDGELDDSI